MVAEVVKTFGSSVILNQVMRVEILDEFRYISPLEMNGMDCYFEAMSARSPNRLKRLSPEFYRGEAWVHWILTIEDRRTGWLSARLLYRFRELLTHSTFRYQIACPIYCLMPDHIHMLWAGLASKSDQLTGMKHFRKNMNDSLKRVGFKFQRQPYDHVLKDEEIERNAIEEVAEYIARNPERKGILSIDAFASYGYTGCLLPGAPLIKLFGDDRWEEVWQTLAFLKRTECYRVIDPKYAGES
jgi:putative transposase